MMGSFASLHFVNGSYLWLLATILPLALLWIWHCVRRYTAARAYRTGRTLPIPQTFAPIGELWVWFFAMIAMAAAIVAVARPQTVGSVVRTAGADVIVLLDASASMRVADVHPDRWQRAVQWVRTFASTLSWRDDRVALGLFAHYAAPQLRLTKDPNALFFFLDHLSGEPPFRLDVDTTWDTNLEAGLYWGVRLLDKNEELYGPSSNAKAFVILTDGQAWSGDVRQSLAVTTQRGIPTYIVGVGTVAGGTIPEPIWPSGVPPRWAEGGPVRAALSRDSLVSIAQAGQGRYFELGREPDLSIALRIIQDVRGRSPHTVKEERVDVYWRWLVMAACAAGLALMFTRERWQLWAQVAAVVATLILLVVATR